ncbi:hypothetical protein EXN22_14225 [Pseudomonas tructae]|uniref:Uncharacterized protein n=1 Tax=Pseudomonas tructae TaxID=2518644 RepID=A0A411MJ24_9PSED|nr:hypothetical protein [Pseudomonas tructae]QBF26791.1 hypothetical protein EXN22_14225 [Pseudomonas tructae]
MRRTKPKCLIHYSSQPLQVFNNRRFQVNTQHRLYSVGVNRGITTWGGTPLSAIVFTGAAVDEFVLHPFNFPFFFKNLIGQYWTREKGDVQFTVAQQVGNDVLHVTGLSYLPSSAGRVRSMNARRLALNAALVLVLLTLMTMALTDFWVDIGKLVVDWLKVSFFGVSFGTMLVTLLIWAVLLTPQLSNDHKKAEKFKAELQTLGVWQAPWARWKRFGLLAATVLGVPALVCYWPG